HERGRDLRRPPVLRRARPGRNRKPDEAMTAIAMGKTKTKYVRVCALLLAAQTLMLTGSCGNRKKSGREIRREQIRNNAEIKRRELLEIAGRYFGEFVDEDGRGQNVTLMLETKDIAHDEEGEEAEVDPV